MTGKRKTGALILALTGSMPLWGGTGRPDDGLLSFILIFGFLIFLLGILQLIDYIKWKVGKFLEDIF
jgi:hypothetical protein